MQYIAIKENNSGGKTTYIINASPLKNTNNAVIQKIPHPLGSDALRFDTLEEAKEAIVRAGFAYVLPNGQKGVSTKQKSAMVQSSVDYSQIILETIKNKINSTNSSVAAAAVSAISEFPSEETFDILFQKLGEDNDQIRKNAIAGICRYAKDLQDRIIKALKSSDWVTRNSAITCIQNVIDYGTCELEPFLLPLATACEDANTIVQANALTTLAKAYQEFQKTKKN